MRRLTDIGERARLGRSEPRPRGSHPRLEKDRPFSDSARLLFGARRAERQPRRLHSPEIQVTRSGLVFTDTGTVTPRVRKCSQHSVTGLR